VQHELSAEHFGWVQTLAKNAAGLHVAADKKRVVTARLSKRLRTMRVADFADYIALVEKDRSGRELWAMIDALAVHQTAFFREPLQFPTFQNALRERLARAPEARVWCAGCSTGEEPYTLAMLAVALGNAAARRTRILATDLSASALEVARAACYRPPRIVPVPSAYRHLLEPSDNGSRVRVAARARSLVRFARHNLVGHWPMRGPLDVIFCRNVMIYFDRPTQQRVVDRFQDILAPGGFLFIGHAEALPPRTRFEYVRPAVYRKTEDGP
jgi:chemotaxis protein methyltransferase CheR